MEEEKEEEEEESVCWLKSGVMEYRIVQTEQTSYHVTSPEKTPSFAVTGKYLSVCVSDVCSCLCVALCVCLNV